MSLCADVLAFRFADRQMQAPGATTSPYITLAQGALPHADAAAHTMFAAKHSHSRIRWSNAHPEAIAAPFAERLQMCYRTDGQNS